MTRISSASRASCTPSIRFGGIATSLDCVTLTGLRETFQPRTSGPIASRDAIVDPLRRRLRDIRAVPRRREQVGALRPLAQPRVRIRRDRVADAVPGERAIADWQELA